VAAACDVGYSYNAAVRSRDPAGIARWSDYSFVLEAGLNKLPPVKCTVYRLVCGCASAILRAHCSGCRALDCPLTQVSHLYVKGGSVWFNSITSTSTDQASSLQSFGSGAGGRAGTGRRPLALEPFSSYMRCRHAARN